MFFTFVYKKQKCTFATCTFVGYHTVIKKILKELTFRYLNRLKHEKTCQTAWFWCNRNKTIIFWSAQFLLYITFQGARNMQSKQKNFTCQSSTACWQNPQTLSRIPHHREHSTYQCWFCAWTRPQECRWDTEQRAGRKGCAWKECLRACTERYKDQGGGASPVFLLPLS